jgi:hypothetical protein
MDANRIGLRFRQSSIGRMIFDPQYRRRNEYVPGRMKRRIEPKVQFGRPGEEERQAEASHKQGLLP